MNRKFRPLQLIAALVRDRAGVTAIEYAVLGGMVSVAVIVGATAVGTNLNSAFSLVATLIPPA